MSADTCSEARGIFLASAYRCGACPACRAEGIAEEQIDDCLPCGFYCDCCHGWLRRWLADGKLGPHPRYRYNPRRLAAVAGDLHLPDIQRSPRAVVRRAARRASAAMAIFLTDCGGYQGNPTNRTLRRMTLALVAYERAVQQHLKNLFARLDEDTHLC